MLTILQSFKCIKGKVAVCAHSRSVQDSHHSCVVCWEDSPLLNVNKYVNTFCTTEHQCRRKLGFYLSKTTLKYIEDFIIPFWWGGILFVFNCFTKLSKTCCICQKRDVNLNPVHCFLAEAFTSLVLAHGSRWHAHPSFSTVNIWGMCAYVFLSPMVPLPPDRTATFRLLINSVTSIASMEMSTWELA